MDSPCPKVTIIQKVSNKSANLHLSDFKIAILRKLQRTKQENGLILGNEHMFDNYKCCVGACMIRWAIDVN